MIKIIEFVSLASIESVTKQTFIDGFGIFYLRLKQKDNKKCPLTSTRNDGRTKLGNFILLEFIAF